MSQPREKFATQVNSELLMAVRTLAAEGDVLSEARNPQCATSDVASGPDIGQRGQNRRY